MPVMPTPAAAREARTSALVEQAAGRAAAHLQPFLAPLAQALLDHLDDDDLAARSDDELVGALLSTLEHGLRRPPGQVQVRVLSPNLASHGWASRHSVLQVVNDDMPFLVDSTTLEIARQGLSLHLIAHPVLAVQRDAAGQLAALHARTRAPEGCALESWMLIEVDRQPDDDTRRQLADGLAESLAQVRAAVSDWPAMRQRLLGARDELAALAPRLGEAEVAEPCAFLQWLADDHFTLLGYRQHELRIDAAGQPRLHLVGDSGLGVLRGGSDTEVSRSFDALPEKARAEAGKPLPAVLVARMDTRSRVHRPGYIDYIGVKRYDAAGQVVGEHRFMGLFTSSAYRSRVQETPLLRHKAAALAERAGFPPGGHLAKAMDHVLESYPRSDLFQMDVTALHATVMGILALGERQRLRLFAWAEPYGRFVSCLVYVPRESYSTELRMRMQALLQQAFGASRADVEVTLSDAMLARVHFTLRTPPGAGAGEVDLKALEQALAQAARRWGDDLRDALIDAEGEARGVALHKAFAQAFPAGYTERVPARSAVADVLKAEGLNAQQPLAVSLYRPLGAPPGRLGLKVYRFGAPMVLSESLPMLENMGARVLAEHNHLLRAAGGDVSLHDFELEAEATPDVEPERLGRQFEEAFAEVFGGTVVNDDFNRLVLRAGLAAAEVVVLRAYARYLRQTGFALPQATVSAALAAQPRIARLLVGLFKRRFDPLEHSPDTEASQVNAIEQALERVSSLSEDRALRQLLGLIRATVRTNFWRTGPGHSGQAGPRRPFLSFKFDGAAVPGLPAPRPLFEIFVYSPRFEGVHLRFGKVARGGLRWSDRPDDFRTEVLGLVKAQQVKNTVIVPVGSKGGFVLKKAPPPSERDAFMKEGVACYQDYLRGLLDLTDNYQGSTVVPPPAVRRHDADDPYLVVAADKGTATFSDYANGISAEYGHWLGDAFASGGSVGYDHKGMGITARGAWESVKRHFRELGRNTQAQSFTVVGIGDMSGDVFGNGMLLSRHIRLLAAFDHRHIFIDPAPDAAVSFAERERLFKLPRSSWADYDAALISNGGGVWSRSEKSIALSPQARQALGIEAERLAPTELISALLKAPVDLLYNGGIGTYVKASSESHAQVGDRANDGLRIDGRELRCKVVGEGGNLGFTQRGRIEAAQAGVRLYTDAIDNSAGVDTSDHEVNIKILLGLAVAEGELTEKQRNALLPRMTDDVAALVLRDNYFQSQALSLARRQGVALLDGQSRFMRFLERQGRLDRALEFLPGEDELAQRRARGQGLASPELAVLLAYGKMWLYDELLASALPEDGWVATALQRYFPALLQEQFAAWIPRHPLRREIICTHVVNSMVNRVGPTFVHRMVEATGAAPAEVVLAYLATRETFGFVPLWQRIEALDNQVSDDVQAQMTLALGALGPRATLWFLQSRRLQQPMQALVGRLQPAVGWLRERAHAAARLSEAGQAWVQAGVPLELAVDVEAMAGLFDALDIAEVADATGSALPLAAEVHAGLGEQLSLARLQAHIAGLKGEGHWQAQARRAAADELAALQRQLAQQVLQRAEGSAAQRLEAFGAAHGPELERCLHLLAELNEAPAVDLAMVSVALRQLRQLA